MTTSELRSRITTELRGHLPGDLIACAPAWLGNKGTTIWVLAGVIAGELLSFVVGASSDSIFIGLGVAAGMFAGFSIKDRTARQDRSLPGGLYVVVGTTHSDLVVVSRALWRMRDFGIAAIRPLDELVSVHVTKRFLSRVAVFEFSNGESWRYEGNRWADLVPGLPPEVIKA